MALEGFEKMGYEERKRLIEEKVKEFFSLVPPPVFVDLNDYIASLKNVLENRLGFEIIDFDMTNSVTHWEKSVEIKFEFKIKEGKISTCIVKMPADDLIVKGWWSKEYGKGSPIIAVKWDRRYIAVNCWV
jgi:hypothetical protein